MLLTAGVLLLGFVAWQVFWVDRGAQRESAQLARQFEQRPPVDVTASGVPSPRPAEGAVFAVLTVPRWPGWAQPVAQGTGAGVLEHAVGHYPGTAWPGQVGNFALAGHRTTHARPFCDIDDLRTGDPVVVRTAGREFVYRVVDHEVVTPTEVRVIAPDPGSPGSRPRRALLTLTSCHPLFSAQQRWVVHAELTGTRAVTS